MSVVALIPARSGSKGIKDKNFKPMAGRSLMNRAIDLCNELRGTLSDYVVSSDVNWEANTRVFADEPAWRYGRFLLRPPELAQDDTPMIDVVKHALSCIPGLPEDIWVLLQPTQPFRTPAHVRAAIALLRETGADSVVSVVELPRTHSPELVMGMEDGRLLPWLSLVNRADWAQPSRRQDAIRAFMRDGTVYAFWRKTVEKHGTIYGQDVRPVLIPPGETCELDTEADWAEAERRWRTV